MLSPIIYGNTTVLDIRQSITDLPPPPQIRKVPVPEGTEERHTTTRATKRLLKAKEDEDMKPTSITRTKHEKGDVPPVPRIDTGRPQKRSAFMEKMLEEIDTIQTANEREKQSSPVYAWNEQVSPEEIKRNEHFGSIALKYLDEDEDQRKMHTIPPRSIIARKSLRLSGNMDTSNRYSRANRVTFAASEADTPSLTSMIEAVGKDLAVKKETLKSPPPHASPKSPASPASPRMKIKSRREGLTFKLELFWAKFKHFLILTPIPDRLLPPEKRSRGSIARRRVTNSVRRPQSTSFLVSPNSPVLSLGVSAPSSPSTLGRAPSKSTIKNSDSMPRRSIVKATSSQTIRTKADALPPLPQKDVKYIQPDTANAEIRSPTSAKSPLQGARDSLMVKLALETRKPTQHSVWSDGGVNSLVNMYED